MTKREAQRLAACIAHTIMTNGVGETAERLVLVGNDRDLGGWAEPSLARHIEKILLAPPPAKDTP